MGGETEMKENHRLSKMGRLWKAQAGYRGTEDCHLKLMLGCMKGL